MTKRKYNKANYQPSITKEDGLKKLEEGIKNLVNSARWKEYLLVQSKFRDYSFNNVMMILLQYPNATQVTGYGTWKKLGRYVKADAPLTLFGEKGIRIWAPMTKKETKEDEVTGEEIEKTIIAGFKLVSVFDISQTDGKPLPEITNKLAGESELYQKALNRCPFPVEEVSNLNGANGSFTHTTNSIKILSSLSEAHKLKTLIHEWGHGLLHKRDGKEPLVNKEVRELEAESVAFVVCNALGLDSADYSFGYLASWGNGENAIELIKLSAKRIQQASSTILETINTENTKKIEDHTTISEPSLVEVA